MMNGKRRAKERGQKSDGRGLRTEGERTGVEDTEKGKAVSRAKTPGAKEDKGDSGSATLKRAEVKG
jgi:hypothetical protein